MGTFEDNFLHQIYWKFTLDSLKHPEELKFNSENPSQLRRKIKS